MAGIPLSAEQRRALELLDRLPGSGCTRTLWAVHSFTFALLVSLVRDGLVDVQAETVTEAGRTIEYVRIRITAAGDRELGDDPERKINGYKDIRSGVDSRGPQLRFSTALSGDLNEKCHYPVRQVAGRRIAPSKLLSDSFPNGLMIAAQVPAIGMFHLVVPSGTFRVVGHVVYSTFAQPLAG